MSMGSFAPVLANIILTKFEKVVVTPLLKFNCRLFVSKKIGIPSMEG